MTVSVAYSPAVYSGNGSTTVFPFPFPIIDPADLAVVLTDANENETALSYGIGWTIASWVGPGAIGSISVTPAPASGTTLTISRATTDLQTLNLRSQGKIPAESIERALDRRAMVDQQLAHGLGVLGSVVGSHTTDLGRFTARYRATVPINAYSLVVYDATAGGWALASPTVAWHETAALFITVSAIDEDEYGTALSYGVVDNPAWSFTAPGVLYLRASGGMSTTI